MIALPRLLTLWICLALAGVCPALDVDMDPCPRFPLA